ncbi:hypothetical protein [Prosthecobacter sp.]|uniref:hypothetical protein n=1 Tax=Prosthecobacter sp. TaxID=1965333 RepID=UPI002487C392|nr:hypothetical protein [Prosthecobacter sp.]MDI1315138.1 hypothetical protein [Prosthecobacter sp.]
MNPKLESPMKATFQKSPSLPPVNECCFEHGPGEFDAEVIGVDETNGRYGDVSVRTCRACGSRWLHYFAEYESFSRSGRWILGLLPDQLLLPLTALNAVPILDSLPWHYYGGSAFCSPGPQRGTGEVPADLFERPAFLPPSVILVSWTAPVSSAQDGTGE